MFSIKGEVKTFEAASRSGAALMWSVTVEHLPKAEYGTFLHTAEAPLFSSTI